MAVKDTSKGCLTIRPELRIMPLTSDFWMLLKTQNPGRPAEMWSPTGQRLHYLIGLLPNTPQAFLLLMSFKAERHLTCMPTLRAELIYTALKRETNENSPDWEMSARKNVKRRFMWLLENRSPILAVGELLQWEDITLITSASKTVQHSIKENESANAPRSIK